MDDAVARGIAYREAGADMLYIAPRGPEEAREIAKRLPPPFMFSYESSGERAGAGLTVAELGGLGYRVLTVANTALAFHRAMKQTYEAIYGGEPNPVMAGTTNKAEQAALHQAIGFAPPRAPPRAPPARSTRHRAAARRDRRRGRSRPGG